MIRKHDEYEKYFFYGRGWGGLCHVQQDLDSERSMSVRGIDNVKMILDDIEDSRLRNVDYIETFICSQRMYRRVPFALKILISRGIIRSCLKNGIANLFLLER